MEYHIVHYESSKPELRIVIEPMYVEPYDYSAVEVKAVIDAVGIAGFRKYGGCMCTKIDTDTSMEEVKLLVQDYTRQVEALIKEYNRFSNWYKLLNKRID